MAILNRTQLFGKVINAIQGNGWTIDNESDTSQQPVRFEISRSGQKQILRVYIWNLTHGGERRPENEYRIQVKVDRFEIEANSKTLILGYWDDNKVFAGFDVSKHIGKPGWSSSMQIKKEVLERAQVDNAAVYSKENGEIAVAFVPEFFMKYVSNLYDIHSTGDLDKYILNDQSVDVEKIVIEDQVEEEIVTFHYSITSYGADYPVDSVVKRIEKDVIFVPPFQRKFVWTHREASRFIESLILGLPVPGIFLSKEDASNRLLIVDGQQRLFTLFSYYKNNFKGRPFQLVGVQANLEGKTYSELSSGDRNRLDDSIIHATVIKQDEPDDSESSIYLIFERLNSSGKVLTPQEIRACVYYGSFNEYLNKIILEREWRGMFGTMNERLKEQEVLLRFFALNYNSDSYKRPLKTFLNDFMSSNREMQIYSSEELDSVIYPLINYVSSALGQTAFRLGKALNVAIFESVMVALSKRLTSGTLPNESSFVAAYNELLEDPVFVQSVRESTADENSVKNRISAAIQKIDQLS